MTETQAPSLRNEVLAEQLVGYLAETFGKHRPLPEYVREITSAPGWDIAIRHDDVEDEQAITFVVRQGDRVEKKFCEFDQLWAAKNDAVTQTLAAIQEGRDPEPERFHNSQAFREVIGWISRTVEDLDRGL